jgi:hypothetical protein
MFAVVGVGQGEPFQNPELGFDQVEPRSLGGCPDGVDVQATQQGQEARVVVGAVQIVVGGSDPSIGDVLETLKYANGLRWRLEFLQTEVLPKYGIR